MNVAFRESFQRDLKSLKKNREMLGRIRKKIKEVEGVDGLKDLPSVKKLSGGEDFYRIRVGDYRIGIALEEGTVVFRALSAPARGLSILSVGCPAARFGRVQHNKPLLRNLR